MLEYSDDLTTNLVQNDWIRIKLNKFVFESSWWIFFHHPYDRPSSYDWNAIEVLRNRYYAVTVAINSYYLLQSPYKTNCKQYYTETEFKSRKECIRMCKLNVSQSKCGVISHEVNVYRGEPNVRFVGNDSEEHCVHKLDLKRNCFKLCPNYDCFKQYIVPKIESQYEFDHTQISITTPTNPMTVYRHKPRIEAFEFVCYIASALSLWFGFSVYSLYEWTEKVYKKTKLLILKKPVFKANAVIIKRY